MTVADRARPAQAPTKARSRGGKAASAAADKDAKDGPVTFIFTGTAKLPKKKTKDNARSLMMKEYYRKQRLAKEEAASSQSSGEDRSKAVTLDRHDTSSSNVSESSALTVRRSSDSLAILSEEESSHPLVSDAVPLGINSDLLYKLFPGMDSVCRRYALRWMSVRHRQLSISLNSSPLSQIMTTHIVPITLRFPILITGFAACSGRQLRTPRDTRVALRFHNEMVSTVNQAIAQPSQENYNLILLGIQGALMSSFTGGDNEEFEIHRKGRARFIQIFGPPQDPDIMCFFTYNSLILGRRLLGRDTDFYGFSNTAPDDHLLATYQMADLIRTIHRRATRLGRKALLATRTHIHRSLFTPGSLMHTTLHDPIYKITPPSDTWIQPWSRQRDMGHHQFVLVYLNLLVQDLEVMPQESQEKLWLDVIEALNLDLLKTFNILAVGYLAYALLKSTYDHARIWKATRLTLVLLRLPEDRLQHVLDVLRWHVCLDTDEPPCFGDGEKVGSPAEVVELLKEEDLGLG